MSEITKVLQTDSKYLINVFASLLSEKLQTSETININIFSPRLTPEELSNLSRTNGIINNAIYEFPRSACNAWFDLNFSGETKAKPLDILDYLMKIPYYTTLRKNVYGYGARLAFTHASGLARKFGSAYIVLGVADGLDLSEPININKIQSIDWMFVYHCHELLYTSDSNAEYYQVYKSDRNLEELNNSLKIHPSRVLEFYGNRLDTYDELIHSQYQHDSVVNVMFDAFVQWSVGSKAVAEMLKSANFYAMGIQDLSDFVRQDIDSDTTTNQEYIKLRAQSVKDGISATNLLVYDLLQEKIENVARNFAGTKESVDTLKDMLASVCRMPRFKLFNEMNNGGGLSTSLEAARVLNFQWSKAVKEWEIENWLQPIQKLCELTMLSKSVYGAVIDGFSERSIIFPIQLDLTELEQIEVEKLAAERAKILLDLNVISPLEIRKQYENSIFNPNIILDDALFKEWENQKELQRQEMINNQNNGNNFNNKNNKNSEN